MNVNEIYLEESTLNQLKSLFKHQDDFPTLHLHSIFDVDEYGILQQESEKSRFVRLTLPLYYSYESVQSPQKLSALLSSQPFLYWLKEILGKKYRKVDGKLYRFGWKDYTVLHDKRIEEPGVDILIDFTEAWDNNHGGYIAYVDGEGNSSIIPAVGNSLTLVERKEGVQRFVKYVNHHAGKNKHALFIGKLL